MTSTDFNYTGQKLDDSGLLFYNARYYDPVVGRFVSPDSIVPGVESGKGGAASSLGKVQNHKLTVDFHEPGFVEELQEENALVLKKGFWFQMEQEDRKDANDPWGSANPQALNRYAYVLNNPMRFIDPTGHTVYLTHEEAEAFAAALDATVADLEKWVSWAQLPQLLPGAVFTGPGLKAVVTNLLRQFLVRTVWSLSVGALLLNVAVQSIKQLAQAIRNSNWQNGVGLQFHDSGEWWNIQGRYALDILNRERDDVNRWYLSPWLRNSLGLQSRENAAFWPGVTVGDMRCKNMPAGCYAFPPNWR